jgi:hypothetical protein
MDEDFDGFLRYPPPFHRSAMIRNTAFLLSATTFHGIAALPLHAA